MMKQSMILRKWDINDNNERVESDRNENINDANQDDELEVLMFIQKYMCGLQGTFEVLVIWMARYQQWCKYKIVWKWFLQSLLLKIFCIYVSTFYTT